MGAHVRNHLHGVAREQAHKMLARVIGVPDC
jgi:hypothetical protein